MFNSSKPEKVETQVRLCKARLGLQKNKRTLATKQMRKEIADLLRNGKQEYARIRVEGVIRENLLMQAYEILGLYLELVAVRSQLIYKTKEIPRDMVEAISSIIYAAQRISDVPELATLRALFTSKYSKEYAAEASSDVTCSKWQVNTNLIRCLLVEPPQPEEKLQMLSEIAQEHGVEWDLSAAARELLPPGTMPNGLVLPVGASTSGSASGGGGGGGGLAQRYGSAGASAVGAPAYGMEGITLPPPTDVPPPQFPPGGFAGIDPQQAAAAAAQAAAHAQAMADWANQMAKQYSAVNSGAAGGGQAQSVVPPPQGWLAGGLSTDMQPPISIPAPVPRTNEEIQKAYDAAVGPPTKGAVPAPSAPSHSPPSGQLPSVPPPRAPVNLPSAPDRDADPAMPQLPRPPKGFGPAEPEDEYDELSRRLEQLKRN